MTTSLHASMIIAALAAGHAWADDAAVRELFQQRFPSAKVEGIAKAPLTGLYEVYADGRIYYADPDVAHVIVSGQIIDAKTHKNLTEERLIKLSAIPFDRLPLDLAVKIVKGEGKRRLAVFEDPDCPYCRQLEKELERVDNVTLYIFLMPIEQLHHGATAKARRIWCAADRGRAWLDAVLKNATPEGADDCDAPIDKVAALARSLRVTGTPTLVFADGRRVPGTMAAAQLEKNLDAGAKPVAGIAAE